MKKLIAILTVAMMVLGIAAMASADVTFKADSRFRGIYKSDDNVAVGTSNVKKYYDSRVRFYTDAKSDKGGIMFRVTVLEDPGIDNALGSATATGGSIHTTGIGDDYAYMYFIPVENLTVTLGLQPADWGNKYFSFGSSRARAKFIYKTDMATFGFFTEKIKEGSDGAGTTGTYVDGDSNGSAVLAIFTAGGFKVGAIYVAIKDKGQLAKGANNKDISKGNVIDIYFNGKIADVVTIDGEYAIYGGGRYKDAGTYTTAQGKTPSGFFVKAGMNFEAVNAYALFATTKNGYAATAFFTPSMFIGNLQPTATSNFGSKDNDWTAMGLGAGTKIGDDMMVGAKFLSNSAKIVSGAAGAGNKEKSTIMELNFSYKIAEGIKYFFEAGTASSKKSVGNYVNGKNKMKATAMYHGIEMEIK